MAIVIFLVKVKLRKPAVVYMLNLAAADVVLISVLPFYIVYRFFGSNWVIGEGMCRFVTAAYYCNMYCSILLMTSISVDRFLAVVYPVRSLSWRTVTRAWLVCGVIWVISLASTVPLLIREQTQKYDRENVNLIICHDVHHFSAYFDFTVTYFSTVISLLFFLPLFITTFCYIGIIHNVSRSKSDATPKRSRAIRLTVVVLSVFVLCFGPTNVLYLITYVTLHKSYYGSLYVPYILSSCISTISCCLDPLIYYFASSKYQRYVYSLLRCKKNSRLAVKQKSILKGKEQQPESGPEGEDQRERLEPGTDEIRPVQQELEDFQ
ncbi:proteinase-activated receptor 1-like [Rana temporaria]|uniref:proteinase-activated receptor 1-like n=1 Tax=Rana temporaria TaxID=8407 RepID=UPI001AADAE61|nr:proteinase-activated receptor 1-like [Rana temporaria]